MKPLPASAQSAWRSGSLRGYTFVELLMSLSIFSIGVTGIIAMQKVTVTSNQHAKNLAVATQIGQAWMDQLRADAVVWNHPSAVQAASDIGDTVWLENVQATNTTWMRPAWNAERQFGSAFDALGEPVNFATDPTRVRYCAHIRLSWLYQDTAGVVIGDGLIRTEVRVFWLRDGQAPVNNLALCSAQEVPASIGPALDRYHFVYNVSAVRENTAQ